jgi:hypothetical protein
MRQATAWLAPSSAPRGVKALGASQGSGVVYAAASDGLYRSDAAPYAAWIRVNTLTDLPQPVTGIYPNPTVSRDLFLLAGRGVHTRTYYSADGGVTLAAQTIFTETGVQVAGLTWALPDQRSSSVAVSTVYATGNVGDSAYVSRPDNGGSTWREILVEEGSYAPDTISTLAVAPGNGGATALIATGGYHGGWLGETTDGGATWISSENCTSLVQPPIQSGFSAPDYLAVSPVDATSIWTWWGDVLWHSADGGRTWTAANKGIADYSTASTLNIAMQFVPLQRLLLLRVNTALYRSVSGEQWEQVPDLAPLGSAMVTVWRSGYLIATTSTGGLLVRSTVKLPHATPGPPLPGTWRATHPVLPTTNDQTATLLPDGSVLVTGGAGPAAGCDTAPLGTRDTQLFDPVSGQWSRGPAMHTVRIYHSATLLADGRVLVVGGVDQSYQQLNSAELFDPRTRTWSMARSLGVSRGDHAATLLRDHRVLIVGTRQDKGVSILTAALYDPTTGTWADTGPLPEESSSSEGLLTAALLQTGDVLLLNPTWPEGALAVYAPQTNSWSPLAGTPLAGLTGVMVTTLHDGRLLASGGETESTGSVDMDARASLYVAATRTWKAIASLPTARAWGAAVTLRDGRVLVVGGEVKAGASDAAEIYDPRTGRWSGAHPMLQGHGRGVTATLLRDGRVLVVGGGTAGAEIFDPGYRFTPATKPASTEPGVLYVPATDHSVAAPFVATYHRLGPYLLGHPLTEPYRQNGVLTQLFDHMRLELRGGHVVAGALGRDLYTPAPRQRAEPSTATRRYFARTGQLLSGDLLAFWQTNGGETLFGSPISGVVNQPNGDGSGRYYLTQWFENACLEIHREIKNPRFHVLLRLLGREYLAKRGWV